VLREANTGAPFGESMARRRFQRGSVVLRGDSWEFRWRDDIFVDGKHTRVGRRTKFAPRKKYPTKKLAWRDDFVVRKQQEINSPTYRPLHRSNFREFADKWATQVLVNLEPSTQASMRSQLFGAMPKDGKKAPPRKYPTLVECLGDLEVKDISNEIMQSLVTYFKNQGAPTKTIKNLITTMRMIWKTVKAWGYATHDPFAEIVFPDCAPVEVPFFKQDHMRALISQSEEPYRTLWWLTGETGIRRGEVCALREQDVSLEIDGTPLEQAVVVVRRKVWNGKIGRPKSKRPRTFVLSPQLTKHLREFMRPILGKPDDLVFTNSEGGMLNPDNLVKRHLKPALKKLGIARGGMHAFRHGNATIMDHENVPMKIRQDRLGHVDANTTLGYTHRVSADECAAAAKLGEILCPNVSKAENSKAFENVEGYTVQ
jgi:integrase